MGEEAILGFSVRELVREFWDFEKGKERESEGGALEMATDCAPRNFQTT